MADTDECVVRPLLCLVEFHRFYENNKTGDVVSTVWLPYKFNTLEVTPSPWHSTPRGGVHGEFDPIPQVATL